MIPHSKTRKYDLSSLGKSLSRECSRLHQVGYCVLSYGVQQGERSGSGRWYCTIDQAGDKSWLQSGMQEGGYKIQNPENIDKDLEKSFQYSGHPSVGISPQVAALAEWLIDLSRELLDPFRSESDSAALMESPMVTTNSGNWPLPQRMRGPSISCVSSRHRSEINQSAGSMDVGSNRGSIHQNAGLQPSNRPQTAAERFDFFERKVTTLPSYRAQKQ